MPFSLETLTSPESVIRKGLPQVISAMVKNLLLISTANLSPYLILESGQDSNSNSTHHFNATSVVWFGYVNMAVVPIGGIVSGFVTNSIGTKLSLQGALAILIFLRLMSLFFKEAWNFYMVVILTNFCSEFFKGPVFTHLAESVEPHLRTTLSASASSSMIFGQFQQILMSTFLSPKVTTYINCALPGICIFLLIVVPETPHALMVKNKFEEARKSLAWYRGWVKIELVEPEYQELLAYHKEEELKKKAEEEEEEQKKKQEEEQKEKQKEEQKQKEEEKNEIKESNSDEQQPSTSTALNFITSKSSGLNMLKGTIEGKSGRLAVLKNIGKKEKDENKESDVTDESDSKEEEPSTSSTLKSRLNVLKETTEGESGRLAALKNISTKAVPFSAFKNVTTGATNQLGSINAVTSESSLLGTVKDKVPIHLLERGFDAVKNVGVFARQSFVLPLALITFTHFLVYFTGTPVLLSQPGKILNSLKSPLDPRYAAVVLAGANVVGSFISVMVIKVCGKRLIVFISLIGMTVCSVAVSLYAYIAGVHDHANNHNVTESISLATTPSWNAYNWIPLVILFLLCIISNFGLCNLPWVLVGELFSKSTRAVGTGIVSGITSLLSSFCNSSLGTLLNILGFSGLYGFYAGVSVAGLIILRLVLPDTEGKTLEEIEKYFDELPFYNNSIVSRYFNAFVSKFRKVNIKCLESSTSQQEKEEINSEENIKNTVKNYCTI